MSINTRIKTRGTRLAYLLAAVVLAGCTNTDPKSDFAVPEENKLIRLGEWGRSGSLKFKAMVVEESKLIEAGDYEEKASRGAKFVLVTVQVMPARKGEGWVDYPRAVRLLDEQGLGYHPSTPRFLGLNKGSPPIKIDAGTFVERVVPFLVAEDFEPLALRCREGEDAKPCFLALRRKD